MLIVRENVRNTVKNVMNFEKKRKKRKKNRRSNNIYAYSPEDITVTTLNQFCCLSHNSKAIKLYFNQKSTVLI